MATTVVEFHGCYCNWKICEDGKLGFLIDCLNWRETTWTRCLRKSSYVIDRMSNDRILPSIYWLHASSSL